MGVHLRLPATAGQRPDLSIQRCLGGSQELGQEVGMRHRAFALSALLEQSLQAPFDDFPCRCQWHLSDDFQTLGVLVLGDLMHGEILANLLQ